MIGYLLFFLFDDHFITGMFPDSGLVVPSITQDLRSRLIESAEQFGLTTERLVEQFGRSAAEMTMQLLGGSCRSVDYRPVCICNQSCQPSQNSHVFFPAKIILFSCHAEFVLVSQTLMVQTVKLGMYPLACVVCDKLMTRLSPVNSLYQSGVHS